MALLNFFLFLSVYLSSPQPLNSLGWNLWSELLLDVLVRVLTGRQFVLNWFKWRDLMKWLFEEVRKGDEGSNKDGGYPRSSNSKKPSPLFRCEAEGRKGWSWDPKGEHLSGGLLPELHGPRRWRPLHPSGTGEGWSRKETPWPLLFLLSDLWHLPKSADRRAELYCQQDPAPWAPSRAANGWRIARGEVENSRPLFAHLQNRAVTILSSQDYSED